MKNKIEKIKDILETILLIYNMVKISIPQIIEIYKKIYNTYIKQKKEVKQKIESTIKGIKEIGVNN